MPSAGWVRLYRRLLDDPVWTTSTSDQKAVLIVILLLASHEPRQWAWEGQKFEVQPGEFVTSLSSLAKRAGVSVKSVRSAIARFEKLDFLANKSAKTGRIISITNWHVYQDPQSMDGKEVGKDPAKTGQLSRMKEFKKEKKESSSDALRLSGMLADLIFANNPNNRSVQPSSRTRSITRWAEDIDRMLRIDHRKPEEAEEVIRWCQENSFWRANILSGKKLRDQFDTMKLQMEGDGQKQSTAVPFAGRRIY